MKVSAKLGQQIWLVVQSAAMSLSSLLKEARYQEQWAQPRLGNITGGNSFPPHQEVVM